MATRTTVSALPELIGTELGVSEWIVIGQDRITTFADATEDHQWIHVDPERAAEGPFGATIAHGYLTLSLVPLLMKQVLVLDGKKRGTNYGVERVRFTAPVRVGSAIRLRANLADAARRPDGGVKYSVQVTIEIRDQDTPALVGLVTYLAYD